MAKPDMIHSQEAQSLLGLDEAGLQNLVAHGELRVFRHGGRMMFRRRDVEKFKRDRTPAKQKEFLIDVTEAMHILGIGANDMQTVIAGGDVRAFRHNGRLAFRRADIEALKRKRANTDDIVLDEIDLMAREDDNGASTPTITRIPAKVMHQEQREQDPAPLTFTRSSMEAAWSGTGFLGLGALLLAGAGFSGESQSVLPLWLSLAAGGLFAMLAGVPLLLWRCGVTLDRADKSATIWLGPGFPIFRHTKDLSAFNTVRVDRERNAPNGEWRVRFAGAIAAELDIPLPHAAQRDETAARDFAAEIAGFLKFELQDGSAETPQQPLVTTLETLAAEEKVERAVPKLKDGWHA